MEKINPNYPAFPTMHYNPTTGAAEGQSVGMSIRTQLAAMAMEGLLASGLAIPEYIAQKAVEYADALIEELNKQKP